MWKYLVDLSPSVVVNSVDPAMQHRLDNSLKAFVKISIKNQICKNCALHHDEGEDLHILRQLTCKHGRYNDAKVW